MQLYLPTLAALLHEKTHRNKIREMTLKREALEAKRAVKFFITAYIKTALQKIGITIEFR
jgi:hypothetical protein